MNNEYPRLRLVAKCAFNSFESYDGLLRPPTFPLLPLPPELHAQLCEALTTGKTVEVDGQWIEDRREHWWLVVQCCENMRTAALWAARSISKRPAVIGTAANAGEFGLRRNDDKVACEVREGEANWKRVFYEHALSCTVAPGTAIEPPSKEAATGKPGVAPCVRKGTDRDFCYSQKRPNATATVTVAKSRKKKLLPAPTRSTEQQHRSNGCRRALMTTLAHAGLMNLTDTHTLQTSHDLLVNIYKDLPNRGVPLNVNVQTMRLTFPSNLLNTAKVALEAVAELWPEDSVPTISALIMAETCTKASGKRHRVSTVGLDGSSEQLLLPESVKIWAGNASPARAPFIGILHINLRADGNAVISRGYLHPAMSIEHPLPVESDEERELGPTFKTWHSSLPPDIQQRVRVTKTEFSTKVSNTEIMVDAMVEFQCKRGEWIVLAYIEHLGTEEESYLVVKKAEFDLLITLASVLYTWKGKCPVSEDDLWFSPERICVQLTRLIQEQVTLEGSFT